MSTDRVAPASFLFALPLVLSACGGATTHAPEPAAETSPASAEAADAPPCQGAGPGAGERPCQADGPGLGHGHGAGGGAGQGLAQGHGAAQGPGGHQHRFDDPARYAERWNSPERDAWQQPELVLDALAIEPGMTVADLGTGTGYFLPWLSGAVGAEGAVLGLDVEPAMIEWVQDAIDREGWQNVEAHQIGYAGPDVTDVDRFLIVNVWHHLDDRVAYATALGDALAAGGQIVIVEYDMVAEPGPPMEMRVEPDEVIADFEAAGFDAVLHPVTLPRQYMVVATPAE